MLKNILETFNLTNKYIILATPLILFSLLSSLYILLSVGGNNIGLIISLVLFTLMLCAFLSGWFFMIRRCITTDEYSDDPNLLLKDFPAGVGEYFLSSIGMVLNIFLIVLVFLVLSYLLGMKLIGDIGISPDDFSKAMTSIPALKTFLYSLTNEQLLKLNAWNLLLFVTMFFVYFVIMLYPMVIFYKEKNPFKAYFISLKELFSNKFLKNIGMYLLLFVSYFILSILTTIFALNPITHFVFTLLNFYYLVFIAVLIFKYYKENYV